MFSSFSKKNIVLSTAVILSLSLSGCGGSNSGTTTSLTKTGVFADAPVEGLNYKTATQSGVTDAQGHFQYKDGETVEFKLGNLFLGKGKAGAFVTPYIISDNNTTATNIAMVLQNFDGNRSNTQVLNLSKLKDFNFTADDINITAIPSTLQSKVNNLLSTGFFQNYVDDTNLTLITETKVKKNMDAYIHKYETEHSKITMPIIKNLVPYTETDIMNRNSTSIEEKLGAAGKLKAINYMSSGQKYIYLSFSKGITSFKITNAVSSSMIKSNYNKFGSFEYLTTTDYKKGTEHLSVKSSKYGSANCVNTYSPILPLIITESQYTINKLQLYSATLVNTTCPKWVNNKINALPEIVNSTENYTLTDDTNSNTKISRYISIKKK